MRVGLGVKGGQYAGTTHRDQRWLAILFWLLAAALPSLGHAAEDALTMGVFPRRNFAETSRLFTPMADYLSERLGRKVNLVTSKNFEAFSKAVTERRYDIVHYNQYHYINSAQTYDVIAHIEEFNKGTIAAVIYVNKESDITSLAQLRGRTIIFGGGQDAMVSYIANLHQLLEGGLKKGDFKTVFAVNPPNAVVALSRGQADAAGVGDGVLQSPGVKEAIGSTSFRALATSELLLQLPFAVRRDMAPELRASIQAILVSLKDSEAGRQVLKAALLTGMAKANDRDYDPQRKMVERVLGHTSKQVKQSKQTSQTEPVH
jgi:phosphonate transport system substrate-binding protein